METGAVFSTDLDPSGARPARQYVAVGRTDAGQTFQSVPFPDYETAEQVANFSRLDADVVEAHVEEVVRPDGEGAEELRC
jgi:hypothetical protein